MSNKVLGEMGELVLGMVTGNDGIHKLMRALHTVNREPIFGCPARSLFLMSVSWDRTPCGNFIAKIGLLPETVVSGTHNYYAGTGDWLVLREAKILKPDEFDSWKRSAEEELRARSFEKVKTIGIGLPRNGEIYSVGVDVVGGRDYSVSSKVKNPVCPDNWNNLPVTVEGPGGQRHEIGRTSRPRSGKDGAVICDVAIPGGIDEAKHACPHFAGGCPLDVLMSGGCKCSAEERKVKG